MSDDMQAVFDEIEKMADDAADRKDYVILPASMVRPIIDYLMDSDKNPIDIQQLRPGGKWRGQKGKLGGIYLLGYILMGVFVHLLIAADEDEADLPIPRLMAGAVIDALRWTTTADNAFSWVNSEATL